MYSFSRLEDERQHQNERVLIWRTQAALERQVRAARAEVIPSPRWRTRLATALYALASHIEPHIEGNPA